jgi:hypothetical protein
VIHVCGRGLQEPLSICWVVISHQYIEPQGLGPFGRLTASEFGVRAPRVATGDLRLSSSMKPHARPHGPARISAPVNLAMPAIEMVISICL